MIREMRSTDLHEIISLTEEFQNYKYREKIKLSCLENNLKANNLYSSLDFKIIYKTYIYRKR